jgi:hypothetical protein
MCSLLIKHHLSLSVPYHSNNSLFSSFSVPSYTPQAHFSVLLILLNASPSESGREERSWYIEQDEELPTQFRAWILSRP